MCNSIFSVLPDSSWLICGDMSIFSWIHCLHICGKESFLWLIYPALISPNPPFSILLLCLDQIQQLSEQFGWIPVFPAGLALLCFSLNIFEFFWAHSASDWKWICHLCRQAYCSVCLVCISSTHLLWNCFYCMIIAFISKSLWPAFPCALCVGCHP